MWFLEWTPTWFTFLTFIPPQGFLSQRHLSFEQGFPGLAESTFQKAKENLLPWEKVPDVADEGWWIKALSGPSAIVCFSPSSPGGREFFDGRMDSATSPSAPRRMTGQRHTAKDESFQLQEAHPKGNLLLCALNLD